MVYRGMIFQFNSAEGTGLVMLSDGETKEFSTDDWVDTSNTPAVGLEIVYDDSDKLIKIKVLSAEEKSKILRDEKTNKEEDITRFRSIEEYQTHFANKGFDLIKNTQETVLDELTMARFCEQSVQRVSVRFKDAKAELTEETILLSNVDDHIKHFQDIGGRLIKDSDDGEVREATLRRYSMDQHEEIKIKSSDAKITVIKTINGKKVDFNKS